MSGMYHAGRVACAGAAKVRAGLEAVLYRVNATWLLRVGAADERCAAKPGQRPRTTSRKWQRTGRNQETPEPSETRKRRVFFLISD